MRIGKVLLAAVSLFTLAAGARPVYIHFAGDSVISHSSRKPRTGVGQAMSLYTAPGYEMVNRAKSGWSSTQFRNGDTYAWEYLTRYVKPGDFLLIHFGHNNRHKNLSFEQYYDDLVFFVREGRKLGADVVLVTPIEECIFKNGEFVGGKELKKYTELTQDVAEAEKVPVIDLNKLSDELFTALGEAEARKLFIPKDPSHFNHDGAKKMSEMLIKEVAAQKLKLAKAFKSVQ